MNIFTSCFTIEKLYVFLLASLYNKTLPKWDLLLIILHSERPKLNESLVFLSAIGLKETNWSKDSKYLPFSLIIENVFVKHYAPNHIPDSKGEWSLKENNSEHYYGIRSKVNQFIYTSVCNYMPNIRIVAKVVLQIFRSQSCFYTKCLCPKKTKSNSKRRNYTENLRNRFKSLSVYLHLGL